MWQVIEMISGWHGFQKDFIGFSSKSASSLQLLYNSLLAIASTQKCEDSSVTHVVC